MKRCIINVANGGWYPRGQDRLYRSVLKYGKGVDTMLWKNGYPAGSLTHKEIPYGFKTFAFKEAIKKGHSSVLWLDASMWAIRDLNPVFEEIEKRGVCVWTDGNKLGSYCSDANLKTLNITRDQAFEYVLVSGGIVGLDITKSVAVKLLDLWHAKATDGVSFVGSHSNRQKQVSQDKRCKGHRHDMPSLSYFVKELGIPRMSPPKYFAYKKCATEKTHIVAEGM